MTRSGVRPSIRRASVPTARTRESAAEYADLAERCRASFNRRFWYAPGGHLYDVVDAEAGGDDASFRPNQIFAVSLDHPVLNRWNRKLP